MSSPWWVFAIMVAAVVPIVHGTVRPWSRCRCCGGGATHRDPATRRFLRHCSVCSGWGTVEAPVRRTIRALTARRVFPHPPERPIDGQVFNRQHSFSGSGGRPRRARTGQPERTGTRRRSIGRG